MELNIFYKLPCFLKCYCASIITFNTQVSNLVGHRGGTVLQCSPLRDTQAIEVTESEEQLNTVQYLNNMSCAIKYLNNKNCASKLFQCPEHLFSHSLIFLLQLPLNL